MYCLLGLVKYEDWFVILILYKEIYLDMYYV